MSEYSLPGSTDRSYTVSGFFIPDEPDPLRVEPKEPVRLRFLFEPNPWRAWRWWTTRWMPKPWRVRLCARFGHPDRCIAGMTEQTVTSDRAGHDSWALIPVPGTDCVSERSCRLCGESA